MLFLIDSLLHLLYSVFAPMRKHLVVVDVSSQNLILYKYGTVVAKYAISTAKNGTGEALGSYQTPRGWLYIGACYGDNQPEDMQFRARRPIGRLSETVDQAQKDPILARVLQLSGLQWHNRDTYRRCVYIHGAVQSRIEQGRPLSLGCVNMFVRDVIALYAQIKRNTWVYVIDKSHVLNFQPCFFDL